jgi:hypothetical protein
MKYNGTGAYCHKTFSKATTALAPFSATITWTAGFSEPTVFTTTRWIVDWGVDCTNENERGCHASSPTVLQSGTAKAWPTHVWWQSSDLSMFPSDYATQIAAIASIPFGKSSQPSHRLSPTAQVWIGVGVGFAVVIIVIILLCFWRRRTKRQRQQRTEHPGIPEMEGGSKGLKRFMGGKWRAEAHGTSEPVEAEARSVRVIPGPPAEAHGTSEPVEAEARSVRVIPGPPAELADTNPGAKQ